MHQMLFRILAHADVADRRGHQDPVGTFQWTKHDLDWKLTSILPPPGELDPRSHLLRKRVSRGSKAVRDQPFREALRNDVLYLLTHEFIAVVPELFLRLNIQQDDLPALVHDHHGIGSRFQQPAVPALHMGQMLFGILAHADVADRRRYQDPVGTFQWAQHDLDRKLTSVLPPSSQLDPRSHLLGKRVSGGSKAVRDQPFREALRNDVLYLLTHELIAVVAELLLRLNIQQDDLSALVHDDHRVRSRFQ